jgi:NADH-quinone oxidoreductase subunit H
VLLTGGMSLARMPELQAGVPLFGSSIPGAPDLGLGWFIFTPVGLLGCIIFFICALAEGERTPFDIPEADSEIVAGYMTEYSGMKFAVFYIAQYLLNFALAVLTAVVFLGGWQGPGVAWLADAGLGAAASLLSLLWLLLKAWAIFVLMVIIRAAVPRLRVDQLMAFAWKYLLPLALVNVASAALWVGLTQWSSIEWGNLIPIDALTPWQRIGVAAIVTAVLNISATRWVLRINRAPAAAAVATIAPA